MRWLLVAVVAAVLLGAGGCGEDCDVTTAPVVQTPCDDDDDDCDDRDEGAWRDSLRTDYNWPKRAAK